MNHQNNSIISTCSGALFGIIKTITSFQMVDLATQCFKVFVFGILGGIGGYIGNLIIKWIISKIKK